MGAYEEERRRRMEENKRRMMELGIAELSKNIAKSPSKTSKPLAKRLPEQLASVRRSTRVTASRPDYREEGQVSSPRSRSSRRPPITFKLCSQKGRAAAFEAAEEILEELSCPCFRKSMQHSHVTGGFWLGLPRDFCREHMPKEDTYMTLEDSDGQEMESLYLCRKNGLSAGWRGFSIDHGLQDGDAVVFELTEPKRFKVHIVPVADFDCGGRTETSEAPVPVKRKQRQKEEPETVDLEDESSSSDEDFPARVSKRRVFTRSMASTAHRLDVAG